MEDTPLIIKRKRVKGDDGHKVFSIRIRDDVVSRLDDISVKTDRSRNELIGILLEYALDRCIIEKNED